MTLPCTDGKELPALLSPPAPHTATDDLVQTCSSPVAQEVRDSLPRNWVDVAWRTEYRATGSSEELINLLLQFAEAPPLHDAEAS